MAERVLTRRELNRALLARQLLLERAPMPVTRAVERLAGLQAQYTPSPYLALAARVEGFERDELTRALERRKVVKALLMRGTLHLVTPRDFWAFSTARRSLGAGSWPTSYEQRMPQRRITELATALAGELRTGSRTLAEVRALLEPHATGNITPALLWRRVQGHAAIVHAPPSGTWGYHGDGVYDAAEAAIGGGRPSADEACARLIRAYLRAFGPATREDLAQWAGLQRLGPVRPALDRLRLRRFLDEQGRTLYDLPGAPLPDPGAPAPPRLVPRRRLRRGHLGAGERAGEAEAVPVASAAGAGGPCRGDRTRRGAPRVAGPPRCGVVPSSLTTRRPPSPPHSSTPERLRLPDGGG
jgi:hypothetical protein